jgi:hypothetical protein
MIRLPPHSSIYSMLSRAQVLERDGRLPSNGSERRTRADRARNRGDEQSTDVARENRRLSNNKKRYPNKPGSTISALLRDLRKRQGTLQPAYESLRSSIKDLQRNGQRSPGGGEHSTVTRDKPTRGETLICSRKKSTADRTRNKCRLQSASEEFPKSPGAPAG